MSRNFSIDVGTLDGLSAKDITIDKLVKSFKNQKIPNLKINSLFKGGEVTKIIYNNTDAEAIQLEINALYRLDLDNLYVVILSLIDFIKKYQK